jgi:large subunit ribosomal protein L4
LDNILQETPNTSEFAELLKNFNLTGKKVTVLTDAMEENLYLGSRNIKNICVVPVESASTYDLLDCQMILTNEASVEILNKQLS